MPFEEALSELKHGGMVCRHGWNGKGMWLQLVKATDYHVRQIVDDKPLLPWIGMKTADDHFVPWLASQTDILAEDWEIV